MVLIKSNALLGLALLAVIAVALPLAAAETADAIVGWKESMLKSFNNLLDLEENKIIPMNHEAVEQLPNTVQPQQRQSINDGCVKTEQSIVSHIKESIEMLEKDDLKFSVERRLNAILMLSKGCMFKLEAFKVPVPPQLEALDKEFENVVKVALELGNKRPKLAKEN